VAEGVGPLASAISRLRSPYVHGSPAWVFVSPQPRRNEMDNMVIALFRFGKWAFSPSIGLDRDGFTAREDSTGCHCRNESRKPDLRARLVVLGSKKDGPLLQRSTIQKEPACFKSDLRACVVKHQTTKISLAWCVQHTATAHSSRASGDLDSMFSCHLICLRSVFLPGNANAWKTSESRHSYQPVLRKKKTAPTEILIARPVVLVYHIQ
jgi:hypothetical protein